MSAGYTQLAKGILSPVTGTGDQSPPGSGATITIWTSADSPVGSRGGARFKRYILHVYSSHDSGANGVSFEVSIDGTNWRTYKQYTYTAANGLTSYFVACGSPYFRVRYTNSANVLTSWEMVLYGDCDERGTVS